MMREWITALLVANLVSSPILFAVDEFPTSPDPSLTPGTLCASPNSYRYAEHIAYCNRSVSKTKKQQTIQEYDSKLGYKIEQRNRAEFKIDHYIPLCMGGSNQEDNLWPQHQSVYQITDPLEQVTCEKMAQGKLYQRDAIEIIRRAKLNLDSAPELLQFVKSL